MSTNTIEQPDERRAVEAMEIIKEAITSSIYECRMVCEKDGCLGFNPTCPKFIRPIADTAISAGIAYGVSPATDAALDDVIIYGFLHNCQ